MQKDEQHGHHFEARGNQKPLHIRRIAFGPSKLIPSFKTFGQISAYRNCEEDTQNGRHLKRGGKKDFYTLISNCMTISQVF